MNKEEAEKIRRAMGRGPVNRPKIERPKKSEAPEEAPKEEKEIKKPEEG